MCAGRSRSHLLALPELALVLLARFLVIVALALQLRNEAAGRAKIQLQQFGLWRRSRC
jgi:hypothetical protein